MQQKNCSSYLMAFLKQVRVYDVSGMLVGWSGVGMVVQGHFLYKHPVGWQTSPNIQ